MYITFYTVETNACELYNGKKIYYACSARKKLSHYIFDSMYSIRPTKDVYSALFPNHRIYYTVRILKKRKKIREFPRYKCNQKSLCYTNRVAQMKRRKYFVNIAVYNEDNSGISFRLIQRREEGQFPNSRWKYVGG